MHTERYRCDHCPGSGHSKQTHLMMLSTCVASKNSNRSKSPHQVECLNVPGTITVSYRFQARSCHIFRLTHSVPGSPSAKSNGMKIVQPLVRYGLRKLNQCTVPNRAIFISHSRVALNSWGRFFPVSRSSSHQGLLDRDRDDTAFDL